MQIMSFNRLCDKCSKIMGRKITYLEIFYVHGLNDNYRKKSSIHKKKKKKKMIQPNHAGALLERISQPKPFVCVCVYGLVGYTHGS